MYPEVNRKYLLQSKGGNNVEYTHSLCESSGECVSNNESKLSTQLSYRESYILIPSNNYLCVRYF